jgi:hypothetical protein
LINYVFDCVPVFCDAVLVDMLTNKHHFCINWSEALSSTMLLDVRKLLLG